MLQSFKLLSLFNAWHLADNSLIQFYFFFCNLLGIRITKDLEFDTTENNLHWWRLIAQCPLHCTTTGLDQVNIKRKHLRKRFPNFQALFPIGVDMNKFDGEYHRIKITITQGKNYLGSEGSTWLVCNKEWGLLWY